MKGKKKSRDDGDSGVARWAFAIALLALGLILLLAGFGSAGFAGDALFGVSWDLLGIAAYLLPIAILAGA